jgi:subtilisin family serine protease
MSTAKVRLPLDENTERCTPVAPSLQADGAAPGIDVVPNRVVVHESDREGVEAQIAGLGLQVSLSDQVGEYAVIDFAPGERDPQECFAEVLDTVNDGAVVARADRIIGCPRLMGGGDEEDFPFVVAAPQPAPDLGRGPGEGVRVVVFDTEPIFHPALEGHIAGMSPRDASFGGTVDHLARGHSLLVAGVILRHAPGAQVRVVTVLDDDGFGEESTLARELELLDPASVDLINLSLVAPTELPLVMPILQRLHAAGVGIVAAAGNDGDRGNARMLPAAGPNVVGVGALVGDGPDLAVWSQHGDWLRAAAPGVDIYGPFVFGSRVPEEGAQAVQFDGWCRWDGTSFSAPAVTGAAAARLSEKRRDGEATGAQTLDELLTAEVGKVQGVPIVRPEALWPGEAEVAALREARPATVQARWSIVAAVAATLCALAALIGRRTRSA